MSKSFDFRRARPWEVALTVFALSAPLLLPLAATGSNGFIRKAVAQEMQQVDSSKLVAIGGAVTEIVYALGEGDRLVARDSTSTFPEEALKLPDVGYMRQLSPEGVIAVNPTAILAVEGSGPPDALAVLKSAGIPFEIVPEGYDRAAILKKIDVVGKFLGVADKAKELETTVAADLDAAVADAAKRPESERKRVLFILSFQNGRVMAAGSHTAADGIISLAGAINATEGAFEGYKPLSDEAIIKARPDVVMVMTRPGAGSSDEEILAHPAISVTPAAASKAVLRTNSLHLLGFGPRTASAIRDLNKELYGNVSQ
ncbi:MULTISPECIES: ABC transporter substrate-binding protein [unclassified Shinella]|uniref:heme/hemin ABC transporter substrate-binding protein n=1 Tax=unclassified Shinella TaxID=2643062 RepID=UPI00225CF37B|nr:MULTISPECIES: ABC transporter substrate-binding protein [unclassified Shinella]MCO5139184.1 ABC transporter substrate-binding protein [Shinella sp.]MDC7256086.1 ABC transporter substrate-binding protein [Shinella sp. YE25]CAI0338926.1 Periplasmic hemin-binding protein [Rhizobiaceae bacterium]CAK7257352.1 iron complex transport system substrate-binding protein [Shinella sp. WSC3-e]